MSLDAYRYFSQNPVHGEQLRKSVVQWLNTHAKNQDRVVLADSGLIPFLSGLTFIDSYCLNNKEMAQFPAVKRYELFCQQILEEKPQIIILTALIDKGKIIYTPGDSCLKPFLDVHKEYKLGGVFLLAVLSHNIGMNCLLIFDAGNCNIVYHLSFIKDYRLWFL